MAMAPVMGIHYMAVSISHNTMMAVHHPMMMVVMVAMMMAGMGSCRLHASAHQAEHSKHRENAK
jgi:hypothetical protein